MGDLGKATVEVAGFELGLGNVRLISRVDWTIWPASFGVVDSSNGTSSRCNPGWTQIGPLSVFQQKNEERIDRMCASASVVPRAAQQGS